MKDNNGNDYVKSLEKILSKFLRPIKDVPFPICIKALTGYNVLSFDISSQQNGILLEKLIEAAKKAGAEVYKEGIFTERPNEAGNHIEPFVISALNKMGLKADKPISKSGKRKTAGYPDIEIKDEFGRTVYLDCKTYNSSAKETSFRTFYFSPSEDPKITKDAFHLIFSFELIRAERKGRNAFIPISWQIYTLECLRVQIKHEFNANNKKLYKKEALLAEGKISI